MISVIVPVYNGSAYIERCINSITGSTFRDIEIIAVENGLKIITPPKIRFKQAVANTVVHLLAFILAKSTACCSLENPLTRMTTPKRIAIMDTTTSAL